MSCVNTAIWLASSRQIYPKLLKLSWKLVSWRIVQNAKALFSLFFFYLQLFVIFLFVIFQRGVLCDWVEWKLFKLE